MLELLFVLSFFCILMVMGVSVLGILAAMAVGFILALAGGMLVMLIKMLPWLLLAIVAVWMIRSWKQKKRAVAQPLYAELIQDRARWRRMRRRF
ncbi:envelope stress response protein PspG [Apirhabdus apintestini]|uniref:envelope stress response protein PspG n=1 Tax=Erwinia sp. HR93 TaxID=3094840 RepID=UPI002ADED571|nr:envelope stress response protein PspG [Erwinia sp. HR93]MEA1063218.1 envelope stress response protein PspG [Erwinia sp. HR93]WPM85002.1 envelope stress response protein PspG [Enterobacteriaceae bacterium CA-0114]